MGSLNTGSHLGKPIQWWRPSLLKHALFQVHFFYQLIQLSQQSYSSCFGDEGKGLSNSPQEWASGKEVLSSWCRQAGQSASRLVICFVASVLWWVREQVRTFPAFLLVSVGMVLCPALHTSKLELASLCLFKIKHIFVPETSGQGLHFNRQVDKCWRLCRRLSIKYDNSEALKRMVTDKRRRDMSQYNDGFEFPCHLCSYDHQCGQAISDRLLSEKSDPNCHLFSVPHYSLEWVPYVNVWAQLSLAIICRNWKHLPETLKSNCPLMVGF